MSTVGLTRLLALGFLLTLCASCSWSFKSDNVKIDFSEIEKGAQEKDNDNRGLARDIL